MSKFQDFMENRGQLLMTIFIIIQSLIFIIFTCLFFIANDDDPIRNNIFICGSQFIFLCFMVHFAYHSVSLYLFKDSQSILFRTHIISYYVNLFFSLHNFQLFR
jgi:hypothetical protein